MSSSKERTKKYRERLKENEEKYEIVSILLIKGWDVIFFHFLGEQLPARVAKVLVVASSWLLF